MDEAEWQACFDEKWVNCSEPGLMLTAYSRKTSNRKLRLLAVACIRHIWHLISDEQCCLAVEVAERYADCLATECERVASEAAAYDLYTNRFPFKEGPPDETWQAQCACNAVSFLLGAPDEIGSDFRWAATTAVSWASQAVVNRARVQNRRFAKQDGDRWQRALKAKCRHKGSWSKTFSATRSVPSRPSNPDGDRQKSSPWLQALTKSERCRPGR